MCIRDRAAVLPETLCSALLTAQWEQRLKGIEQGQEKPEQFMRDIRQFVSELTRSTKRVEQAERLFPPLREKIGTCPKCGAAITERAKGFMCENRTCDFALWKNGGVLANAQKPLTSGAVSYTHLDVYKRQRTPSVRSGWKTRTSPICPWSA